MNSHRKSMLTLQPLAQPSCSPSDLKSGLLRSLVRVFLSRTPRWISFSSSLCALGFSDSYTNWGGTGLFCGLEFGRFPFRCGWWEGFLAYSEILPWRIYCAGTKLIEDFFLNNILLEKTGCNRLNWCYIILYYNISTLHKTPQTLFRLTLPPFPLEHGSMGCDLSAFSEDVSRFSLTPPWKGNVGSTLVRTSLRLKMAGNLSVESTVFDKDQKNYDASSMGNAWHCL